MANSNIKIEWRAIDSLHPYRQNARTHSERQVEQIAASIKRFGFVNPILLDAEDGVIAGHGRLLAARRLELARVPTIRLEHLSEAEKRAYILADNKIAERAGWDRELLKLELQYLHSIDLDLTVTGFETPEIDLLLSDDAGTSSADDELPAINLDQRPVSCSGDLWLLGSHRLLCGDATSGDDFETLMAGTKAQMVFVDPPYNVPIERHARGLGRVKHRNFLMASGEMSPEQFETFLIRACRLLARHSTDGSIHFICMDWRHIREMLAAGDSAYGEFKNLVVWNKANAGMGAFYRSRHELVFVFKNGKSAHINNFSLGEHGRYRTNVWDYAGVNSFREGRDEELSLHPTVKPVLMVADAIRDCSHRSAVILDSFAGSGTTVIAAERTNRIAYGMELDPRYVDVAIKRWQRISGMEAKHACSGRSFQRLARERKSDLEPATTGAAHV